MQVTNSPSKEGLGTHCMGGAAFGGHSCPDAPEEQNPNHTRSRARAEIVRRAHIIRNQAQYSPRAYASPTARNVAHRPKRVGACISPTGMPGSPRVLPEDKGTGQACAMAGATWTLLVRT
jgi:hypothetical protein